MDKASHSAISLLSNDIQRHASAFVFGLSNIGQMFLCIYYADLVEIVNLAAGQNSRQYHVFSVVANMKMAWQAALPTFSEKH